MREFASYGATIYLRDWIAVAVFCLIAVLMARYCGIWGKGK